MFSKKNVFKNFFQAKKVFKNVFSGDLYLRKPKKRSKQIFRKVSGVFQQNFNGSKIVLSSSRGQGNFRGQGLQNVSSRPRTFLRTPPLTIKYKTRLKSSILGLNVLSNWPRCGKARYIVSYNILAVNNNPVEDFPYRFLFYHKN